MIYSIYSNLFKHLVYSVSRSYIFGRCLSYSPCNISSAHRISVTLMPKRKTAPHNTICSCVPLIGSRCSNRCCTCTKSRPEACCLSALRKDRTNHRKSKRRHYLLLVSKNGQREVKSIWGADGRSTNNTCSHTLYLKL